MKLNKNLKEKTNINEVNPLNTFVNTFKKFLLWQIIINLMGIHEYMVNI
jgi:hypothetical protein